MGSIPTAAEFFSLSSLSLSFSFHFYLSISGASLIRSPVEVQHHWLSKKNEKLSSAAWGESSLICTEWAKKISNSLSCSRAQTTFKQPFPLTNVSSPTHSRQYRVTLKPLYALLGPIGKCYSQPFDQISTFMLRFSSTNTKQANNPKQWNLARTLLGKSWWCWYGLRYQWYLELSGQPPIQLPPPLLVGVCNACFRLGLSVSNLYDQYKYIIRDRI